jgi:integrase
MPKGKTRPVEAATVRRELGTLRAAVNHCHREGYLTAAPPVTLPDRPAASDRWLTRDEAARLLRAALRSQRGRHLARFILIGVYTGTRKSAILGLEFAPNTRGGWIDVEQGLLYRRPVGKAETAKRTPPARMPDRLLAHARRWQRLGRYPVEYQGGKVADIKTAWAAISEEAGLPGIVPHVLRHTAITWALQGGAAIWDAAGYFGASVQSIQDTYGHHSPNHQESARNAMDRRHLVRYPVRTDGEGSAE